jgi:hypothetical protein
VGKVIDQLRPHPFPVVIFIDDQLLKGRIGTALQMVSRAVRLVKKNFKSFSTAVSLSHQQKTIPI